MLNDIISGKLKKVKIWNQLKRFIAPELGVSQEFCGVKSINKDLIKNICLVKSVSLKIYNFVIDVVLFFGYCWSKDWKSAFSCERLSERDKNGIKILKTIGEINKKEIKKLFSEFSNLLDKHKKQKKNNESLNFSIIKNSIRKSNLKFPWSFAEVRESAIKTFLSFSEFIYFYDFPKNTKSKNFFNQSELFCPKCSSDYCSHLYNMRKNLIKTFKKKFDKKSEIYFFLLGFINSHIFFKNFPRISFQEFLKSLKNIRLNQTFLLIDPIIKILIGPIMINLFVSSIIKKKISDSVFCKSLKEKIVEIIFLGISLFLKHNQ